MSPREQALRDALRGWIVRENGRCAPEDIVDTTNLVEGRILRSIQLMELLTFIEELRGRPVDVSQLGPGTFRDIDGIYESFFADVHGDGAEKGTAS